jgi:hypothetical protein
MNVGSGILHGIGDGIAGSMNNSEIKGMEKKLFANPNTKAEFHRAVFSMCVDIGVAAREIIETHGDIELTELQGKVVYNGEDLAGIDDEVLGAKINNNLSVGNLEYCYAMLVEKLRRSPMDSDALMQLYKLSNLLRTSIDVLEQYKGDFGLKVLLSESE